jgi:hypothetical protein
MADAKQAWDEVGAMFGGLGLKLKMHFEQARSAEGAPEASSAEPAASSAEPDAGPSAAETTGGGPTGAEEDRAGPEGPELKAALRKLADALDGTFDAVGNAVRDPAVKEDVRDIGRALSDAFSATFAEVSDDLRKAFRRRDDDPGDKTDKPADS